MLKTRYERSMEGKVELLLYFLHSQRKLPCIVLIAFDSRCCGTRIRVEMSSGRSRRDDRKGSGGGGGGGGGGRGGGGSERNGTSGGGGGRNRYRYVFIIFFLISIGWMDGCFWRKGVSPSIYSHHHHRGCSFRILFAIYTT